MSSRYPLFAIGVCVLGFQAGAARSALAQAQGQPFEVLARQVAELQGQVTELRAQVADGTLARQVADLQSQVTGLRAQVGGMEQQLAESRQVLERQGELLTQQGATISMLRGRMVFDGDSWVGWRNMTLHGPTRFTNDDDESIVTIGAADSPVVAIYSPHMDSHFGQRRALEIEGLTRFVSSDPSSQYHPALEVVGPAWYRQTRMGPFRATINDGGDPNYAAKFIGPTVFVDEQVDDRWLSFFTHSTRPIHLEGEGTYIFSVYSPRNSGAAAVEAAEFNVISPP